MIKQNSKPHNFSCLVSVFLVTKQYCCNNLSSRPASGGCSNNQTVMRNAPTFGRDGAGQSPEFTRLAKLPSPCFSSRSCGFGMYIHGFRYRVHGISMYMHDFRCEVRGFSKCIRSFRCGVRGFSMYIHGFRCGVRDFSMYIRSFRCRVRGFGKYIRGFRCEVRDFSKYIRGFRS